MTDYSVQNNRRNIWNGTRRTITAGDSLRWWPTGETAPLGEAVTRSRVFFFLCVWAIIWNRDEIQIIICFLYSAHQATVQVTYDSRTPSDGTDHLRRKCRFQVDRTDHLEQHNDDGSRLHAFWWVWIIDSSVHVWQSTSESYIVSSYERFGLVLYQLFTVKQEFKSAIKHFNAHCLYNPFCSVHCFRLWPDCSLYIFE